MPVDIQDKYTVVIIARVDCWKCKDIEAVCIRDGIVSQTMHWHDGGAAFLAKYKHIPTLLPSTLVFKEKELLWCADGLAEFLEKWEETHGNKS